jgi:hypothetical protein
LGFSGSGHFISSRKPKLAAEERRVRTADRLAMIRLRVLIGRALDERGITTPDAIGAALEIPAGEATALLSRSNATCPARSGLR